MIRINYGAFTEYEVYDDDSFLCWFPKVELLYTALLWEP